MNKMQYNSLLLQDIAIFYEVDLTEDRIIHIKRGVRSTQNSDTVPFSKIIAEVTNLYILPKCRVKFARMLNIEHLIEQFDEGATELTIEFASKEMTGSYRWYKEIIQLLRDSMNGHIMAMLSVRDIHEQKARELSIEKAAHRDPLTNLLNRGYMKSTIESFLKTADPSSQRAALIILDLDNFKQVNDTYGHIYGDQLLCAVAEVLSKVFPRDLVGRLGGDEFILFMRRLSSEKVLQKRLQRLQTSIHTLLGQAEAPLQLSASVGAALYPVHGTAYTQLYAHADQAQYQAKRSGKNTFCIYDDDMPMLAAAAPTNFISPEWLLDEISDGIYVCDTETNMLLYVNQTMAKWFDIDRSQISGSTKCYEAILCRSSMCPNCPRPQVQDSALYVRERTISIHGRPRRLLLKTKIVQWNGRTAQLEVLVDLTHQKETAK